MAEANFARGAAPMQRGSSLVDVLMTCGVATSLVGLGLLGIDRSDRAGVRAARHELVGDLRHARMQATLEGSRMRFEAGGDQYVITRVHDDDGDGAWERDASFSPVLVRLPSGLSVDVSSPGSEAVAEFDGRGLLVPRRDGSLGVVAVTVSDRAGRRAMVRIWPSGQVEEAAASAS